MNRPLPVVTGHFVLESGMHADTWVQLDAMFVDPAAIAPRIAQLAELLGPYRPTMICGPMTGGALLAQAVATEMGLRFVFAQRSTNDHRKALFAARYELPAVQRESVGGQRIALVDDMISAGSSTLATLAAVTLAGGIVVVVGTLHLSGQVGADHFARHDMPLVAVERRPLELWAPDDCPLCRRNEPLSTPAD